MTAYNKGPVETLFILMKNFAVITLFRVVLKLAAVLFS